MSNIFMLLLLPQSFFFFFQKNVKNKLEKWVKKLIFSQSVRRKLEVGQFLLENTDAEAMNFSLVPFQFLWIVSVKNRWMEIKIKTEPGIKMLCSDAISWYFSILNWNYFSIWRFFFFTTLILKMIYSVFSQLMLSHFDSGFLEQFPAFWNSWKIRKASCAYRQSTNVSL